MPKINAYTTAIADPSVAVKIPATIPPMTTTIRDKDGNACKVATPRYPHSNFPGLPLYPFRLAMITATIIQHSAHIIPGTYPARNNAATEVPPETREYVINALDGGIRSPEGADAALVAAQTAGSYPCSSSPSRTMLPTAAAAAEAEPEIAPNNAFAPTFVTKREPGNFPRMANTKLTNRFAIPP